MNPPLLKLVILAERLAVCRLDSHAPIPEWAAGESFLSISRTRDELSVICEDHFVPAGVQASRGWRGFKIVGPLDLDLVGSLVSVAVPLAQSNIGILPDRHFRNRLCPGSRSAVGRRRQSPALRGIRSGRRELKRQKFRSCNSGVQKLQEFRSCRMWAKRPRFASSTGEAALSPTLKNQSGNASHNCRSGQTICVLNS